MKESSKLVVNLAATLRQINMVCNRRGVVCLDFNFSSIASKVTPADDLVLPKNVNHPHPKDIITYNLQDGISRR